MLSVGFGVKDTCLGFSWPRFCCVSVMRLAQTTHFGQENSCPISDSSFFSRLAEALEEEGLREELQFTMKRLLEIAGLACVSDKPELEKLLCGESGGSDWLMVKFNHDLSLVAHPVGHSAPSHTPQQLQLQY